jgi:hypothetical protein
MVTWQVFVRLAYQVAEQKGAQFGGIESGSDFIEQLAPVWQSDKERIKQMTENQAENYLDDVIDA